MRRSAEALGIVTAGVVGVALVLGGAFDAGERVLVGALAAVLAAWLLSILDVPPKAEEWCALAVIAWGGLAAMLHSGYPLAAKEMVGGWLVAWVIWLAAARARERARAAMSWIVAVAAIVVAVTVLFECLGALRPRMGGLFVNPNVAAAILVPAVPLIWLSRDRRSSAMTLAIVAVLTLGTVATGSRAGLLALVVVAGLMLPKGRLRTTGVAALVVVAGGLLLWRFAVRPDTLAWHRIEIWRALWTLVAENPLLGVGPGWLEEATGVIRIEHVEPIARFGHVIGGAESAIYGLLVRCGFVGLGLAVASCVLWLIGAKHSGRLGVGSLQALVGGLAVLAAFHDLLDVDIVLWWWALLLGMAWATGAGDGSEPESRGGRWPRTVAALALGGLVLWCVARPAYARWIWWNAPSSQQLVSRVMRAEPWLSDPAEWSTMDMLRRERWTWESSAEAMYWSGRAVEIHSGSARLWSQFGRVRGRIAQEIGPWEDVVEGARAGFQRACELEPRLPWYRLQWAQFERAMGETDRALELTLRSLTDEPNFVRGWLLLARLQLDLGNREQAAEAFERAETAARLAGGRFLKGYERDLLTAPSFQVRELSRELSQPADGRSE